MVSRLHSTDADILSETYEPGGTRLRVLVREDLADDLRRAVTGLPRHVAHVVRTTDMVVSLARARWAAVMRPFAFGRTTSGS